MKEENKPVIFMLMSTLSLSVTGLLAKQLSDELSVTMFSFYASLLQLSFYWSCCALEISNYLPSIQLNRFCSVLFHWYVSVMFYRLSTNVDSS